MRRLWTIRAAVVLVIGTAAIIGYQAGAQDVEEKNSKSTLKPGQVMRVGDKIITAEDLVARIWDFEQGMKPEQRILADSLTYLRDTALLDLEAKRLGLAPSPDEASAETNRQIDMIKAKVKEDTHGMLTYQQWLDQQGLTKDGFENYVRDRARIILLKRVLVRFFEETTDSIEAYHILLKTRERAEDIHGRLKNVAPEKLRGVFEDLAVQHSIDPAAGVTRGMLPRLYENDGTLVEEASKACWLLEDNEYSEPVKTEYGYHIFLRTATYPGKDLKIANERDRLIKLEDRQAEEDYFNRWVRWVFNTQMYKVERRLPGYDVKPNE